MFAEVDNLLHLDLSCSQLISIVEQSPADASFVLCHLINSALKADMPVCVLALDKPPSHYRHLCGKCGGNVRQAEAAGTLTFIDGAEMALLAVHSDSGPLALSPAHRSLEPLFDRLVEQAGRPAGGGLLLLDSLSALVELGASLAETLLLMHNLLAWSRQRGGLLVTLTALDADDEPLGRLAAAGARLADVTVTVRGLASGHCPEVTGELEVRRPGAAGQRQQFKAEDRNVRVFAPGTSRAVL